MGDGRLSSLFDVQYDVGELIAYRDLVRVWHSVTAPVVRRVRSAVIVAAALIAAVGACRGHDLI